jgi:hypothetical protein
VVGEVGQGFWCGNRGFRGVVRMDTDGAPDVGVGFGQGWKCLGLHESGADGHDLGYAGGGGARQDIREFGCGVVVEVAVRIY